MINFVVKKQLKLDDAKFIYDLIQKHLEHETGETVLWRNQE